MTGVLLKMKYFIGVLIAALLGLSVYFLKRNALPADTLRISFGSDPLVIDPQMAETGLAVYLAEQLSSTLLEVDHNLKISLKDAQSYEWKDNGKKLRVKIKKGLLWSDGSPVFACQYRDGILRALNPKILSPYADIFFDIQGAESYKKSQVSEEKVGIHCNTRSDDLDFDVTIPYSHKVLYALAFVNSAPARIELVNSSNPSKNWILSSSPRPGISNGSFVLKKWQRDQRIVLEKNPYASQENSAQIQNVEILIVRDTNTAFTMYESKELDVLDEIPASQLAKISERKDLHSSPWLTTYMIGLSFKAQPLLKNIHLRKALARVAQQDEIPFLLKSGEMGAKSWAPPSLIPSKFRENEKLTDIATAKKELALANLPKDFELKLYFNGGERHKILMERFAHLVKLYLGIKISLYPTEWKVLLSQLHQQAPDLYRYAWTAVYPDALFFLDLFNSKNINNFGAYSNNEYDKIIEELKRIPLEKRNDDFWKKVQKAERILTREDPGVIPIYHYQKNTLMHPRVKGLEVSPRGLDPLKKAYF